MEMKKNGILNGKMIAKNEKVVGRWRSQQKNDEIPLDFHTFAILNFLLLRIKTKDNYLTE